MSCGIQTARNVFKNLQAREVDLVAENSRIQAELNDANALIEKGKEILTKKENDLLQVSLVVIYCVNEYARILKQSER